MRAEAKTPVSKAKVSSKTEGQVAAPPLAAPSEQAGNFYERFTLTSDRFPDRLAVVFQRSNGLECVTYAELRCRAEAAAAFLANRGISAGDTCALSADNSISWCGAYLGILRAGGVAVPLDVHYTPRQIAAFARDCGARILLTTPRYLPTVRLALREGALSAEIALLDGETEGVPSLEAVWNNRPIPVPRCVSAPHDAAVILYTSGTTSDPKGVVLTHANLLAEIEAGLEALRADERDSVLGVLPLYHALALVANLLLPFSVGASVIFLEELKTSELLRALREHNPTAFCCVPRFFDLIHEHVFAQARKAGWFYSLAFRPALRANGALRKMTGIDFGRFVFRQVHQVFGRRMRLLITAGARFEPAIGRDFFRLGFNLIEVYGLTETTGAATVTRPGDGGLGTVGWPLPGVEVAIFPLEGMRAMNSGVGEIAIRGPIVMQGYLNRLGATAEAMRDDWLLTGDLGRFDSRGRLVVTGRKKEVIVLSSGKNIYPEEVESHYARCPYIREICVLGLPLPGETSADHLSAVVVPNVGMMRARKVINMREVLRFEIENLSLALPIHQRILGFEVWTESLPRTTTNKLKRYEIERRLLAQRRESPEARQAAIPMSEEEAAWAGQPRVARALDLVKIAARHKEKVRPDANLELDLGLDSIARVELLTNLESLFSTKIPSEVAENIYTVRQLVEAVRAHELSAVSPGAAVDPWGKLLADLPEEDPAFGRLLKTNVFVLLLVYAALKGFRVLAWLLLGLRVTGLEHLPHQGPYLLCPNHQSYLDSFLLASSLPFRILGNLFFLGASEYFATPFRATVARQLHIAPVDPDTNLVRALQAGALVLKGGKVLVLFPEGERSINGEVKQFRKGAAILATQLRIPIVPVAIEGSFHVWPRNRPFRWNALLPWKGTRTSLRFGPAISPSAVRPPNATAAEMEEHYADFAEHLRTVVVGMQRALRDEWHGAGRGAAPR